MHSDYHGHIELLYSARKGPSGKISSVLFMKWIHKLFEMDPQRRHHYTVFCTDPSTLDSKTLPGVKQYKITRERSEDLKYVGEYQSIEFRPFDAKDFEIALGPVAEREKVVAYVCGPPPMTEWAVAVLQRFEGMDQKRVLCEKWW